MKETTTDDVIIRQKNSSKPHENNTTASEEPINNTPQNKKFDFDIKKQTKMFAILFMIFATLLFFALISHTAKDDLNTQFRFGELFGIFTGEPNIKLKFDTTFNMLGLLGAFISDFLINGSVGIMIVGLPAFLFFWGFNLYKIGEIPDKIIRRTNMYLIFSLNIACIIGSFSLFSQFANIPKEFYGAIGIFLPSIISRIIFPVGALIIFLTAFGFLLHRFTNIYSVIKNRKIKESIFNIAKKITVNIDNSIDAINDSVRKKNKPEKTKSKEADDVADYYEKTFIKPAADDVKSEKNHDDDEQILINKADYFANNGAIVDKKTNDNEQLLINISENKNIEPEIIEEKITNIFDKQDNYSAIPQANKPQTNANIKTNKAKNTILEEELLDAFRNKIQIKVRNEDIVEQAENNAVIELITAQPQAPINIELPKSPAYSLNDILANEPVVMPNQPIKIDLEPIASQQANTPKPKLIIDVEAISSGNNNENNLIKPSQKMSFSRFDDLEEYKTAFKNPLSLAVLDEKIKYTSPIFELLDVGENENYADDAELQRNGKILQEKLQTFKINISNLEVTKGPVVTQYEFVPADGIKISKIEGLANDLSMALKAKSVRIIAPVPGRGTVGIQIPNLNPSIVRFRSVISSSQFANSHAELPIALGKTVSGEPFIADLAKMPHLLIAGSTGSGKSVGINTVISSLLYKKHPRQLKLIIIDPKKVELQQYARLSNHFLAISPDVNAEIFTDTQQAITALNAAVLEMEKRYDILAKVGTRNIKEYNEKVRAGAFNHIKDFDHRELPYIVAIVDELGDLMLTARKDIETPIVLLAQKARACGIHMIVATQRPSVDVITGIIKANFPARIAYLVAQKNDSRTILDVSGAEALLGNGDMLFSSNQPTPIRIQNPFISTDEVEKICDFIGDQQGYSEPYMLPSTVDVNSGGEFDASEFDSLFRDAAELIIASKQASTSMLQRRLKIGFARAGRIIDELESASVIGPSQGSKPRAVLIESVSELEKFM